MKYWIPCIVAIILPSIQCQSIYDNCGNGRTCVTDVVGELNDCINQQNCDYVASFANGDEPFTYNFMLQATLTSDEDYIAFGFSEDQNMEDDFVISFGNFGGDGSIVPQLYWNVDKASGSFSIFDPTVDDLLSNVETSIIALDDGRFEVTSTFDLPSVIVIPELAPIVTGGIFLLDVQPYYVIFATGPIEAGFVAAHGDQPHGTTLESVTFRV